MKFKKSYIKIGFSIIFWVTILSLLLVIISAYLSLSDKFDQTTIWEKRDTTPMSEKEAYALYLDEETTKLYNDYIKLVSESKNKENKGLYFTDVVTADYIKELEETYQKLPDNLKSREEETYSEIIKIWEIKSDFDKLFNMDTNTVYRESTIVKFITFLDSHQEYILAKKGDIPYLEKIYTTVQVIQSDLAVINNLLLIFEDTLYLENKLVKIKPSKTEDSLVYWKSNLDQLQYRWEIVSEYLHPIVEASRNELKKNQTNIQKYNDYTVSIQNRENYDKFVSDYNYYKSNLIDLPNFRTQRVDAVVDWAGRNNIRLEVNNLYSDTVEEGRVITQESNIAKIMKGSIFSVDVSAGPEPRVEIITVPVDEEEDEEQKADDEETTDSEEEQDDDSQEDSESNTSNTTSQSTDRQNTTPNSSQTNSIRTGNNR